MINGATQAIALSKQMRTETAESFWAKIYITGPMDVIEQVCRAECLREGLCVTIDHTKFIYTGGEEVGAVIGLINYPRFPSTPDQILDRAKDLASKILESTFQHSVLVMTPKESVWVTKRY